MTAQVEGQAQSSKLDLLKWLAVVIVVAVTIVGFYHFAQYPLVARVGGVVLGAAVAVGLALMTAHGRAALEFAKDARTEVRKVVWPTRQETVQTTLVIAGFVVVMSLLLWGVDAVLVRLVGWITGQGA